jgi:hypothetical protein
MGFGPDLGFESMLSPSLAGKSLTTGELGNDIVVADRSLEGSDRSLGLLRGLACDDAFKLDVATSTTSQRWFMSELKRWNTKKKQK